MKPAPLVIALIASAALLQGCAAALTAASVAGGAGVQEALNGIKDKTFGAPVAEVRRAALNSLERLAMKVEADKKTETGWQIDATARDRDISVTLEAITVRSTRMRVVVSNGELFFQKDAATSNEIIAQATRALADNGNPPRQLTTRFSLVSTARAQPASWPDGPPGPPPRRPPPPRTVAAEEGWSPSSFFGWLTSSVGWPAQSGNDALAR